MWWREPFTLCCPSWFMSAAFIMITWTIPIHTSVSTILPKTCDLHSILAAWIGCFIFHWGPKGCQGVRERTYLEIESPLRGDQAHRGAFYRRVYGGRQWWGFGFKPKDWRRCQSNGAAPVLVALHCTALAHLVPSTWFNWFSGFNPSQTTLVGTLLARGYAGGVLFLASLLWGGILVRSFSPSLAMQNGAPS